MKTPELENRLGTESKILTMSFEQVPFSIAMSEISAETGASIVWGKDADETYISGVYSEVDVNSLLLAIAKRYGMEMSEIGGLYYMGTPSNSDLVSTVVRSPTSDKSISAALAGCLSEYGKLSQNGSCLIISDYLFNVKKILDVVSQLRENNSRAYVAEVYFIRMKNSDLIDMQAKLQAQAVDLFSCSWNLDQLFNATLNIAGNSERMHIQNRPILYLAEGRTATLEVGSDIVLSRSAVSSEGYSTVSGYDTFSDGVKITLTPSRISTDLISLDVDLTVSKFTEEISSSASIPTTSKSSILSPGVLVTDGSVFFLGSLQMTEKSSGFTLLGWNGNKTDEIVTVWVKIREILLQKSGKRS